MAVSRCSSALRLFHHVFLEGTSTFDAWLNATSFQMSQVLLTLPYSFAQLGMASGIIFQLIYATLGCWACYTTTSLYLVFRKKKQAENILVENYNLHTIQWHEVLDGLLGSRWRIAALVFNTGYQFLTCVIFIAGCSSLAYILDDTINKRSWTVIFGGCFLFTVLIPRAQHYRIWSCMGVIALTYTAWYLTFATIAQGRQYHVKHTAPTSSEEYFTGATNLLYAFGGHAVTVEIVDAMRKPKDYKSTYSYCILYVLTLALPSAITVYWAFGDTMLHNSYAIYVLPDSRFRQTAAVLMLLHQFMQFGFLSLPLFMNWEKYLGIHQSNYWLISAARVPVVLMMWFFAIMVPFIGLMDSVVGAIFTTFSVYILPCVAHMVVYRTPTSRSDAQLPYWMPSWTGVYCLNLLVVLWVFIVGVGFGGWSGLSNLLHKIHTFGLFPKCYQCQK